MTRTTLFRTSSPRRPLPSLLASAIVGSLMVATAMPALAQSQTDLLERYQQQRSVQAAASRAPIASAPLTAPASRTTAFAATAPVNIASIRGAVLAPLAPIVEPGPVMGAAGDRASWQSEEFQVDWGLSAINADAAYARGLTGQGSRLGVFDSGTGLDHDEFAGKDHHSLTIGDLLADGTRCVNTTILDGPDACFSSSGDDVAVQAVFFDASVPQNIRDIIESDPRYVQPGVAFQTHGTHVAGTIAANRDGEGMHGVAFGADLTAARLFFNSARAWARVGNSYSVVSLGGIGPDTSAFEDMYAQMNADGVRAVNHSWGLSQEPETVEEFDEIYADPGDREYLDLFAEGSRQNGMIQVWAAGNSSDYNPSPEEAPLAGLYASLPRAFAEIEPYWLAVVNVNQELELSDLSHRCGLAANWCLAAPGSDIVSTSYGDDSALQADVRVDENGNLVMDVLERVPSFGYEYMSGTSMAAPHVTGALGLLFERYPYLDNAQVRDVLLTTATDLGAEGVDDVYGWGLVNLEKAIEGYGLLRVDTDVVMNSKAGGLKVWEGEAWDDWTNDIGGPGKLTKSGIGWLRLSGDNSFNGALVRQGILELDGVNALSDAVVVDGGQLLLNGSLVATDLDVRSGSSLISASGVLDGSGLRVADASVQLDGVQNDASTEVVNGSFLLNGSLLRSDLTATGSTLRIGSDALLDGSALTASNSQLQFDGTQRNSWTLVEGGQVALNGSLVDGSLVLTDSLLAVGSDALLDGATLSASRTNVQFDGEQRDAWTTIDGGQFVLTGTLVASDLDIVNASAWINKGALLDGSAFSIDHGTVAFNGVQTGGSTFVGANALLQGTGTLGTTRVEGTIAPGNSIGTLTVDGDYVQTASGTYLAELAPGGISDLLHVTGTARLDGTLKALPEPGTYYLGEQFNFLQADGGVEGRFATADFSAFSPFLQFGLGYGADGINIEVTRGQLLASAASTANQRAVAGSADGLAVDQGLPQPLTLLFPQQVGAALDGLSGELHAAVPLALVESSRYVRDAALSRAVGARSPQDDASQATGAWVQAIGGSGKLDGNANTARTESNTSGLLVGIDHEVAGWNVGLLLGNGRTDTRQAQGRSAKARIDNTHVGLYAGHQWGALALRGGLGYSRHDIDSTRQVGFAGFSDGLNASYDAKTRQAFLEAGYRFGGVQGGLEPYLQVARVEVDIDDVRERGGAAALNGKVGDTATTVATAGVRFDKGLKASFQQDAWLHVVGGVGYRRASGDRDGLAQLAFDGGSSFAVNGAPIADSAVVAELGLSAWLTPRQQLELGYNGQFGDESRDHGVNARWSVRF